jgi:hypothetical protein
VWFSPKGAVDVAVKTLKEGSGEEDRVKFLQEAAIMGQFKHPNVVTMYGLVMQGEPVSPVCVSVGVAAVSMIWSITGIDSTRFALKGGLAQSS